MIAITVILVVVTQVYLIAASYYFGCCSRSHWINEELAKQYSDVSEELRIKSEALRQLRSHILTVHQSMNNWKSTSTN